MSEYLSLSPISQINDLALTSREIGLYLKRDDLIPGAYHGNKIRKLKGQIDYLHKHGKTQILTFGGAFSNHIYAVAALGAELEIETIGYIRGEPDPNNPTLKMARQWGMQLHFVSRTEYRLRYQDNYLTKIQQKFPDALIVPEGGHHQRAYAGLLEMVSEVRMQHPEPIDYWICPYATGSTAIGIARALRSEERVLAFAVLKGLDFAIEKGKSPGQLIDFHEAHYGGFAKKSTVIEDFILRFYKTHHILLDPIYTGRMMHALFDMVHQDRIKPGSRIMAIHTGGHQGIRGYNYRYGTTLPIGTAYLS